ncbi:DUF3291 domain-containing protein [Lutimaribacter marinistellae]|uniref:DUF3291 domain-containing protein n=1 Tax=Lutimaribacter marinistellae TaxID=1820329 RepID=A0ABV7TLT5_9RHOB
MQPRGHHIAEFNIGVLRYDWDDPRVKDFADNIDRVNAIAARSPGFVWRLSDADMEAAQTAADGPLGGNPRTASTLSVWEDIESLERFVWQTVHKQFYDRKDEWYAPQGLRMVLWWVPEGHRPTVEEAKARFDHLAAHGDSDHAFGWAHASGARLWKSEQCGVAA